MRWLRASSLLLSFVAFAVVPVDAHKFHASLAEVDVNAKKHTIELGIRVFADDLELALSRRRDRTVRLDVTPDVGKLVLAYLRDSITIADRSGRRLELEWIGMELRVDEAWLYVQASAPDGIEGGTVGGRIFFDLYDDQVNTMNFQEGDSRVTLTFTPGQEDRKVTFAGDVKTAPES